MLLGCSRGCSRGCSSRLLKSGAQVGWLLKLAGAGCASVLRHVILLQCSGPWSNASHRLGCIGFKTSTLTCAPPGVLDAARRVCCV